MDQDVFYCVLTSTILASSITALGEDGIDTHSIAISNESKATNTELAKAVADAFRRANLKNLQHYNLEIRVSDGVIELSGKVSTEKQRQCVIDIARNVPGTTKVINLLAIKPLTVARQQKELQREFAEARKLIRELDKRLASLESIIAAQGNHATTAEPPSGQHIPTLGSVFVLPVYPSYLPYAFPPFNGRTSKVDWNDDFKVDWNHVPRIEWNDYHWELKPPKSKPLMDE